MCSIRWETHRVQIIGLCRQITRVQWSVSRVIMPWAATSQIGRSCDLLKLRSVVISSEAQVWVATPAPVVGSPTYLAVAPTLNSGQTPNRRCRRWLDDGITHYIHISSHNHTQTGSPSSLKRVHTYAPQNALWIESCHTKCHSPHLTSWAAQQLFNTTNTPWRWHDASCLSLPCTLKMKRQSFFPLTNKSVFLSTNLQPWDDELSLI